MSFKLEVIDLSFDRIYKINRMLVNPVNILPRLISSRKWKHSRGQVLTPSSPIRNVDTLNEDSTI
jgi:hypothetical protein